MDQIARAPKQVGEILRRRRRALGLTQQALGTRTGLRQATISGLETGRTGTQLRTICDVMATLELEIVIRPRTTMSLDEFVDLF